MKKFQRIDVPGDNSCFFHAIGVLLHTKGPYVKQLCINGIIQFADHSHNGTSIRQWIEMDGYSVDKYVSQLKKPSFWGGAIEMHVLCTLLGKPIVVYELKPGNIGNKIAVFHEDLAKTCEPLSLLYLNKNHYAALVPVS
jgi:hypothetical protein